MSCTSNSNSAGKALLLSANIAVAVAAGKKVRQAATISRAAEEAARAAAEAETASVRVCSVLGEVPALIAHAVSISMSTDQTVKVPVMALSFAEYDTPAPRRPSNKLPENAEANLQLGAVEVFNTLADLGLCPEIGYKFEGMTRTYSLQIWVTVRV